MDSFGLSKRYVIYIFSIVMVNMATVVQLEDGIYEGEVNRRGKPHGLGTKRYLPGSDVKAITAQWEDGYRGGGPYTVYYTNGNVLKGDDSRIV